jgi:hypothetical protein
MKHAFISMLITKMTVLSLLFLMLSLASCQPKVTQGKETVKIDESQNMKKTETPYKMDFNGAESITVTRIDYDVPGHPTQQKVISDSATINRINELLAQIPKKGDLMKSMVPHRVHKVEAYKNGEAFAMISFARSSLRTENTGFNAGDRAVKVMEDELFSIIEIKDK